MTFPDSSAASPAALPSSATRFGFLDQLRGYAVAGMLLVNYLGNFEVMPWTFKHHREGFSYADSIAPLFMFISGTGFRMGHVRRAARAGRSRAHWEGFRRCAALVLIGFVAYGPDLRVDVWDALTDIGLAGLLALPFIGLGAAARIAAAFGLLGGYQVIHSGFGYGPWTVSNSINGGPLGPLSWAFIFLMGTVAADWLKAGEGRRPELKALAWAAGLSAAGWALRAPWGEAKASWPFSAYAMSAPYALYSAGLSFAVFALFHAVNERAGILLPHLTTLGRNALVVYLLQYVAIGRFDGALPSSAPAWQALCGLALVYLVCWAAARKLEKDGLFIKV